MAYAPVGGAADEPVADDSLMRIVGRQKKHGRKIIDDARVRPPHEGLQSHEGLGVAPPAAQPGDTCHPIRELRHTFNVSRFE